MQPHQLLILLILKGSFKFDGIAPTEVEPTVNITVSDSTKSSTSAATTSPYSGLGNFIVFIAILKPQGHSLSEVNTTSPSYPAGVNTEFPPQGTVSDSQISTPSSLSPDFDNGDNASIQTTMGAVNPETSKEQTTHQPQYPFLIRTNLAQVRLADDTGEIHVSKTGNFIPEETIRIQLLSLIEKALNDAGEELDMVPSSQTANLMDGGVMSVSMIEPPQYGFYPGSNTTAKLAKFQGVVSPNISRQTRTSTKILFTICTMDIDVYIFNSVDEIANGNDAVHTYPGLVQIDTSIREYRSFCEEESPGWLSHCLQRNTHSLEFKAIAEPVLPQSSRKDVRGKNFMYFGGLGYVIMKQKVIIDNKPFALGNENIVTHNETKPWVGIQLTVPRFESKVTTKINIELGCFGLWCSLEPHFQYEDPARLRGLSYYPTNNISQQVQRNGSTTLAYTSTGCLNSLSLKPIAFLSVVFIMF